MVLLKQEMYDLCTKLRIGIRGSNNSLIIVMRPHIQYRFLALAMLFIIHDKNFRIQYYGTFFSNVDYRQHFRPYFEWHKNLSSVSGLP
jgi:hypothetical protein